MSAPTLRRLWRELLPLAWSDLNLALVDPAITATLTHLPDPRTNVAAIGIGALWLLTRDK